MVQLRRRKNQTTEKNSTITILHIAASITLTALLLALVTYLLMVKDMSKPTSTITDKESKSKT